MEILTNPIRQGATDRISRPGAKEVLCCDEPGALRRPGPIIQWFGVANFFKGMGWISSIVRSEILLIPTSRFIWIVVFYMDMMLLYLSNIKLFYALQSHVGKITWKLFQQHNATVDPSILRVSCMQSQFTKIQWPKLIEKNCESFV